MLSNFRQDMLRGTKITYILYLITVYTKLFFSIITNIILFVNLKADCLNQVNCYIVSEFRLPHNKINVNTCFVGFLKNILLLTPEHSRTLTTFWVVGVA